MSWILVGFLIWFAVSIPVGILTGKALRRRSRWYPPPGFYGEETQ